MSAPQADTIHQLSIECVAQAAVELKDRLRLNVLTNGYTCQPPPNRPAQAPRSATMPDFTGIGYKASVDKDVLSVFP